MAPDGQTWATSTRRSTCMASGWIHGPCTLARNTLGAQVTQKREWMHFLESNISVRSLPSISSTPATVLGVGGAAPLAAAGAAVWGAAALEVCDDTFSKSRLARSARSP